MDATTHTKHEMALVVTGSGHPTTWHIVPHVQYADWHLVPFAWIVVIVHNEFHGLAKQPCEIVFWTYHFVAEREVELLMWHRLHLLYVMHGITY